MNRKQYAVYFIMGTQNAGEKDALELLETALKAGITMFQFREKGEHALTGAPYETFARACQHLCKQYRVPFIVNDDVELAIKLQADGLHIGQEDEGVSQVKSRIGSMLLGVSVHTEEEVQEALSNDVDYVGIGPIFSTKSKEDAKDPAGTAFLERISVMYPALPIVAIGGITEDNAPAVRKAGADGVAVISTICESPNIMQTVALLKVS